MATGDKYWDRETGTWKMGVGPKWNEIPIDEKEDQYYAQYESLKTQTVEPNVSTGSTFLDKQDYLIGDPDVFAMPAYSQIDYKFRENQLLCEIRAYIDATYGQHYAKDKIQATEFIIDAGHGTGFCVGNVLKYAKRYGHKGTPDKWREDLMKVIHYAIIQLHVHDLENPEGKK